VRTPGGVLLALLGVVVFSLTLPVTKVALTGFDAWTVAAGRTALAGLVALGVLLATRAPRPSRQQLPALAATTAGVVLGFPFLTTAALQLTTASHAAVVIAALPIATAVLAVLRTREPMGALFWLSSTVGTLAVTAFALTRGGAEGGALVPDLLLLGAVVLAAVGYTEGGGLAAQVPGWVVISWALVAALPVTMPVAAVAVAAQPPSPTATATVALLFLALGPQYTGFFAFYAGLARAGVARASQTQLLQPLLTLGWSVLLLGETVGAATLLAAGVVVLSVAGTQRGRREAVPPAD
jgi:drug/metabolite transporter (DMT)-like permease